MSSKYVVQDRRGRYFGWDENWTHTWVEDLAQAHELTFEEAEEEVASFADVNIVGPIASPQPGSES